ncbi:MAG: GAF domain-containing protein [Fidelibacterota bacterium]|nr:MAG: GAF domain-containing protein [Candidatus Neomarinimicrobiota bacterium]
MNEEWLEAVLNLIELTGITDVGLIANSLEAAIRLTGSSIGYLHIVSEDREHTGMYTRSDGVWIECGTDRTAPSPLGAANIWADCLRTRQPVINNAYQNPSGKTDYPEGYIHITRHMSVPIPGDQPIVAIAGVVNKKEPYTQSDARCLFFFMNSMWCILERKKMQERAEILVSELRQVLDNNKSLSGLLPICSSCKRIRDHQGSWNQLEAYLHEHIDVEFTHGICPECARELYPNVDVGN